MPRFETKYATIPLSGSVTDIIALAGAKLMGLSVPAVTSAALYVQGSWEAASASLWRLQNPAGSGDWTFAVGPGSKAITLQDVAFPWPYLRIETSVAQAAVRSLAVVAKF